MKTRLAASVGHTQALEIYKWLTAYTHQITKQITVDKFIFYSDFIPEASDERPDGYQHVVQSGTSLGDRMRDAFMHLFDKGYSRVVIIGTDSADLKATDLNKAYLTLSHTDLVIGPAKDGGYYLLGMSRFYPELFYDIPWSTSKVLELTLDKADQAQLDYEFLNIRSDVDTLDDWEKVRMKEKVNVV